MDKYLITVNKVETQLIEKNIFLYIDINNKFNEYRVLSKAETSKKYLHASYRCRYREAIVCNTLDI
jgi:hypothetical protein